MYVYIHAFMYMHICILEIFHVNHYFIKILFDIWT